MDRFKADRIINRVKEMVKAKYPKMELKMGRCVFTTSGVSIKFELAEVGEDGVAKTREAVRYPAYAALHGLPELGTSIMVRGVRYTITGWRTRSRKSPVLTKREDGKLFVMPVEMIRGATKVEVE